MKIRHLVLISSSLFYLSIAGCKTVNPATRGLSFNPEKNTRLIRSDYTEGEVKLSCQSSIDEAMRRMDKIVAIAPDKRTFQNTMVEFDQVMGDLNDAAQPLLFMSYVSTNPQVAAEGAQCEELWGKFNVNVFTRKDLYQAIKDQSSNDPVEARLLQFTKDMFESNGLMLPDDKLAQVKELLQTLEANKAAFLSNINKDMTTILYTAEDLKGVPEDYLSNKTQNRDGKYVIGTKETDFTMVMENAEGELTRQRMMEGYWSRAAGKNVKLLEESLVIRKNIATLMGFKTWADYQIRHRMAPGAKQVMEFLGDIREKLAKKYQEDLTELRDFKASLQAKRPGSKNEKVEVKAWDINYLAYQLKKKKFNLDTEMIRDYFPADHVTQGIFDIYSNLLGVYFKEVKDAKVWGPGVKLYEIHDEDSGELIAYFYTDLFPREGKYSHAAAFNLITGHALADGTYSVPVSAIVANMAPPTQGKPSRLSHDDVETFFHEFGHIMHQTLTRVKFSTLAGTAVAQDFVEAPSQMLENWVWNAEVLNKISGRWDDPSKKLPPWILKQLIAARDFQQGYFFTRQLMLGNVDMSYHMSNPPVNTTQIYEDLYLDFIKVEAPKNAPYQAAFGHLMGGYDAGYYGYLWSKVYAEDMATRFENDPEGGLLSVKVGRDYRKIILERGNEKEALDLVRMFLRREPNMDAFFKKIGISN